ncbi:MAG TPA: HU family DNA-binding protein [Bryobacteraceae bacterium]|nr:HU family DNA-binding protein [Bryobacteraceae bacterium]
MRKEQLTAHLARSTGQSRAAAADQLDRVVHDILARLRRGEAAELPGLGKLVPGENGTVFKTGRGRKR